MGRGVLHVLCWLVEGSGWHFQLLKRHDVGVEMLHLLNDKRRSACGKPEVMEFFVAKAVEETERIANVIRHRCEMIAVVSILDYLSTYM